MSQSLVILPIRALFYRAETQRERHTGREKESERESGGRKQKTEVSALLGQVIKNLLTSHRLLQLN